MSDDLVKSLIGAVGIGGALIVWMLLRRNGHPKGESPEAIRGRNDAVARIIQHIDEAERRIQENVNKTRHDIRGVMTTFGGDIIEELKKHIDDRMPRRRS